MKTQRQNRKINARKIKRALSYPFSLACYPKLQVFLTLEADVPLARAIHAETEEELASNLFHVRKYPATIFASPTSIKSSVEAYKKLGSSIEGIPFLIKDKKLYTFENLKSARVFHPIISENEVFEEKLSNWMEDQATRNHIIFFFNSYLRTYCKSRGLIYDKKHNRFVCQLKDGKTNYFAWRREVRPAYRKIAVCNKGKDGEVLYCKHYAAELSFMFLDDSMFLKIEPTYVFTYDGYKPIRSEKLASLMSARY